MITRDLLRSLRNDLPMDFTIQKLGNAAPYSKCVEGRLRFHCQHCHEIRASINPRNNLAHCFSCGKNINNIDLVIAAGHSFVEAVALLQEWLFLYKAEKAAHRTVHPATPIGNSDKEAESIGALLRQEFGNRGSPSAG